MVALFFRLSLVFCDDDCERECERDVEGDDDVKRRKVRGAEHIIMTQKTIRHDKAIDEGNRQC